MKSPQKRFQESEARIKTHQDMVSTELFQDTVEKVIAQYVLDLASTSTPAHSWNNACKIEGAKEVMGLFIRFADKPAPRNPPKSHSLETV